MGAPIKLSIGIKNASNKAVKLNFPSGQKFDFIATREGQTDSVWSYGMNKRFTQSPSTMSLGPGKTLRYETTWEGAKPGKYLIRALVKANGGIKASPFKLTVKPASTPALRAAMPKSPFTITTSCDQNNDALIKLSLEIKNSTQKPIELKFTSGQKFDFIATPVGATEAVWSYGMNRRFTQALSTMSLEPGKSLQFETTWEDAKPGKYLIRAVIKANNGIEAAPFEFEVK